MTTFDVIAVILISISAIYSFFRGMVKEVFSLLFFIVGYVVAVKFSPFGTDLMSKVLSNPAAAKAMGYVIMFLAGGVAVSLIGMVFKKLVRSADTLSAIDRVLGAGAGVVKAAFLIIVFLVPLELFPDLYQKVVKDSVVAPPLEEISTAMRNGMGSPKQLLKKLPKIPLDGIGEKLKDLDLKNLKDLAGKIDLPKSGEAKTKAPAGEEFSKEDKKQLEKIFESIQEN